MSELLHPSKADCTVAKSMAQARSALREALTLLHPDGDFWFASERRIQNIDRDLAAMEMLFVDLYGSVAWAKAVSAAGDG